MHQLFYLWIQSARVVSFFEGRHECTNCSIYEYSLHEWCLSLRVGMNAQTPVTLFPPRNMNICMGVRVGMNAQTPMTLFPPRNMNICMDVGVGMKLMNAQTLMTLFSPETWIFAWVLSFLSMGFGTRVCMIFSDALDGDWPTDWA